MDSWYELGPWACTMKLCDVRTNPGLMSGHGLIRGIPRYFNINFVQMCTQSSLICHVEHYFVCVCMCVRVCVHVRVCVYTRVCVSAGGAPTLYEPVSLLKCKHCRTDTLPIHVSLLHTSSESSPWVVHTAL